MKVTRSEKVVCGGERKSEVLVLVVAMLIFMLPSQYGSLWWWNAMLGGRPHSYKGVRLLLIYVPGKVDMTACLGD